jgi:TolA-binding protein
MHLKLLTTLIGVVICHSAFSAIPAPQKANSFPEGEKLVYARIQDSYRKGDIEEVSKQRKLLEKNYPQSIHLDNAYYLLGALEFSQDHLGEALREFDAVVNRFTQSNKRPAALFAMGMTYKKLNLPKQALAVFQRVINIYPGSVESQRAWMELRLTNAKPEVEKKKR